MRELESVILKGICLMHRPVDDGHGYAFQDRQTKFAVASDVGVMANGSAGVHVVCHLHKMLARNIASRSKIGCLGTR